MRSAVLDHLNNYAESVCIDCGFVQRDCKCTDVDRRHCGSQLTYVGSAVSVKDTGIQTEPMVVIGMPPPPAQKVNAPPGISFFIPQNYHLSSDVRMPLPVGQQHGMTLPAATAPGMNINTVMPNVINFPPTLTFPAGCSPSFVNPLSASSQSYVGMLRQPLLGIPSVPNSSGVEPDSASRKRKLDADGNDVNVAHASVQTMGKSYVKKMKVRLGNFSASDFKIVGRESHSLSGKNHASGDAAADAGAPSNSPARVKLGGETGTNSMASPGGHVADAKKDTETPVEKKCTTVWKLLEDSSDEECAALSEPTSATQGDLPLTTPAASQGDLPLITPAAESPPRSEATTDNVLPQSDLALNEKTHDDESIEQKASVSEPQTLSESNKDAPLHDQPVKQEPDDVDDDVDRLVIDANANHDNQQQSEQEDKPTAESNDWEFRNGTQETESADEEKVASEAGGHSAEQPEAVSKIKDVEDGKSMAQQDLEEGASAADVIADASHMSKLGDFSPSKSTTDAAAAADDATVQPDSTGDTKPPASEPKPCRVYGKFEYTPTGEHILRCRVPKCSQTFDRKLAADVHNHVHPGFVPGTDGSEGPTYLQCHRCEFQAPFYHWYDLLRHMRQKHDICLVDGTTEHTCEYCGLGFDSKDELTSHIDFHYSNRYKCINCGLLLLTWAQVTL